MSERRRIRVKSHKHGRPVRRAFHLAMVMQDFITSPVQLARPKAASHASCQSSRSRRPSLMGPNAAAFGQNLKQSDSVHAPLAHSRGYTSMRGLKHQDAASDGDIATFRLSCLKVFIEPVLRGVLFDCANDRIHETQPVHTFAAHPLLGIHRLQPEQPAETRV